MLVTNVIPSRDENVQICIPQAEAPRIHLLRLGPLSPYRFPPAEQSTRAIKDATCQGFSFVHLKPLGSAFQHRQGHSLGHESLPGSSPVWSILDPSCPFPPHRPLTGSASWRQSTS